MQLSMPISTAEIIQTQTSTIEDLIEKFIADQDIKLSSKGTYRRAIKQYFEWIEKYSYQLRDITRTDIVRYKEDLLADGLSGLTVGSYITVLRRFYEWAESQKLYPNVARGVKSPKRKQQFRKQPLTISQSTDFLANFQDQSKRDTAIVNLLIRTGLRTIEVSRADVKDIQIKGGKRVLLVQGKGRDEKDSFVILSDKTFESLQEHLNTRGKIKPSEPLFISQSNNRNGERLTTRTISKIAKEGLKRIGLDDLQYSAHSLRHTTAVSLLRAGGSLQDAQGVLRHSNPSTTQIYTATIEEEMRLKNSVEELLDTLF